MSKIEKTIDKLLRGSSDNNFDFDELVSLLKYFGFSFRIRGSHNIFYMDGIAEIINLQSKSGKAKSSPNPKITNNPNKPVHKKLFKISERKVFGTDYPLRSSKKLTNRSNSNDQQYQLKITMNFIKSLSTAFSNT